MKIAFSFGVLIALVTISSSNGFVVQTEEGKNSSQEIQPNKEQELQQTEKNNTAASDPSESPNQNDQAKTEANPAQNQNVNETENQSQHDSKTQQLNEKPASMQNRRSFDDDEEAKYKRFEVRKRSEDAEMMREENEEPVLRSQSYPQELDSVVMSVDTGAQQPNEEKYRSQPDPFEGIEQMFQDITKNNIPSNLIYRAKQDLDLKPSYIRFKSSQQPTLKLEVTSTSIVKALENLLATPEARRYADVIGQQAADAYLSLTDQRRNSGIKENYGDDYNN